MLTLIVSKRSKRKSSKQARVAAMRSASCRASLHQPGHGVVTSTLNRISKHLDVSHAAISSCGISPPGSGGVFIPLGSTDQEVKSSTATIQESVISSIATDS